MRAWLRLLTVCLMALALPFQGLASAAMLHCGPGHEQMQVQHDHAQAPHDGAHVHTDGDRPADLHDTAKPTKFAELSKHKCSSCASCCTGLALLNFMPSIAEPGPVLMSFDVATVEILPVAQSGPDRPPRP